MSDLGGIDMSYTEGKMEKKRKNYLKAARLFRMCHYYYTYGELPVYYWHLECYGLNAIDQYEYCKSKLTDDAQRMLEEEENMHFDHWREFIKFNDKKIEEESYMPSPNRPKEKWWWKRWFRKRPKNPSHDTNDNPLTVEI